MDKRNDKQEFPWSKKGHPEQFEAKFTHIDRSLLRLRPIFCTHFVHNATVTGKRQRTMSNFVESSENLNLSPSRTGGQEHLQKFRKNLPLFPAFYLKNKENMKDLCHSAVITKKKKIIFFILLLKDNCLCVIIHEFNKV